MVWLLEQLLLRHVNRHEQTKAAQRQAGAETLSRFQAFKLLSGHIEESMVGTTHGTKHRPDSSMKLEQFTRARWLPTKEAKWRGHTDAKGRTVNPSKTSAEHTLSHIFRAFGTTSLERLDSVALQRWLNGLAGTHSESLVKHCRYYLKSILEWAVWEDYLRKESAKYLNCRPPRRWRKSR